MGRKWKTIGISIEGSFPALPFKADFMLMPSRSLGKDALLPARAWNVGRYPTGLRVGHTENSQVLWAATIIGTRNPASHFSLTSLSGALLDPPPLSEEKRRSVAFKTKGTKLIKHHAN